MKYTYLLQANLTISQLKLAHMDGFQSIQHLVEITRGIEHLASDKHAETGLIAQIFRFQEGTGIEVNNSHVFL